MGPLPVDTVHLYPLENAQIHNTLRYEVVNQENPTVAIVRRGQPFTGVIRFKRPIDEENDVVRLLFTLDDQTYMAEQELLQEYVLNDAGKVWMEAGYGRPWLFGQFDDEVLPACMFVLSRAKMQFHHRGDPIKITRAISRIVNANDDQGVLIGRWNGRYEAGTAPMEWTGSGDILQQYHETKQAVAYGQCWVFAAVVTTICRALGIPSRPVTNIVSAHDANSTLSIDMYYTEDMDDLHSDPNNPNGGVDSVWNFHVWNDVWMARPDLPPGYGGWQAIDATPQEKSSGLYQCGPAPVEAVKQGMLGLNHDIGFMVATVNADLMRWRRDHDSETGWSIVDTTKYHIGRRILTKKPYVFDPNGDEDKEDITHQYKHKEGTASERLALMNGVRHSERAKRYYSVASNLKSDVSFNLVDIDSVFIGKPFIIEVNIDNNGTEGRHIKAVMTATSIFYNGVKSHEVKKVEKKIFVGAGKNEQIGIFVTPDDYVDKLVEYGSIKITAMAIVVETKQSWADDDVFQVGKPIISVMFKEDLVVNQPATTVLKFYNPLDKQLTGCEFRVTSSGIAGRTLKVAIDDVGPKGLVNAELPVQPLKLGVMNLVATFKSNKLKDISGARSGVVSY